VSVAAYSDAGCTQQVLGPVTVDASANSSTYFLVYFAGGSRKVKVLPIP
jgi:hypothetical protein